MKRSVAQMFLGALLCALSPVGAELPEGFTEEVLIPEVNAATALTVAPDGRILFADQTGLLHIWKNGRVLSTPALDLTDRVDSYWERGLIGATLHPDFPQTPHLFVVYVAKEPYTHHVISRFTVLGDFADPASEFVLLKGDDQKSFGGFQPAGHQGGSIQYGPDGKLYIGLGEQTDGSLSQSLNALQGKILRINVDGTIPSDNPFLAQTTGKYRAIWAIGLRNPFGLAFEPDTGRLFESDVGQTSWEEINEILPGANYGWPEAEGPSTNSAFKNPLHAYPPTVGRSIVGAVFYPLGLQSNETSGRFPEKWRGKFFFADWAANWVKALDPAAPSNVLTFARGFNAPVALEVDLDGSLLVLNRGTIWRDGNKWQPNSGSLVRIRYGGRPPESSAVAQTRLPALPRTLAESGLFNTLTPITPNSSFVPFQINLPPWQPGIKAERWISLPKGGRISINLEGEFEFSNGTTVLQHYTAENAGPPIETQVLWFIGPRTVRAAAYRWSAGGKRAQLVEDGEVIPLPGDETRRWFSPGAEERLSLDSVVAGFVLPLSPRQINRQGQLQKWNDRGWFVPSLNHSNTAQITPLAALEDTSASLETRVRSYLDVNCASCHRPGGPSRGSFDARFIIPLSKQNLLNGELVAGDLGIAGARLVVPGDPERSILLQRVSRDDAFRMPPISVNAEPQPILAPLTQWVREMTTEGE